MKSFETFIFFLILNSPSFPINGMQKNEKAEEFHFAERVSFCEIKALNEKFLAQDEIKSRSPLPNIIYQTIKRGRFITQEE